MYYLHKWPLEEVKWSNGEEYIKISVILHITDFLLHYSVRFEGLQAIAPQSMITTV